MRTQVMKFCLQSAETHACKASVHVSSTRLHVRPTCAANSAIRGVSAWLKGLQQSPVHSNIPTGPALASDILRHVSHSANLLSGSGVATSCQPAAAEASTCNRVNSISMQLTSAALVEQHIQWPEGFAIPKQTTVPAYQLVGVFRAMLGCPELPQGARASSLEAKWGLLHLLLLHAAGQHQQYEQRLQGLLDRVLLKRSADKLMQVLVNPLVPQPSKQSAEERYQQLHTSCSSTIAAWVTRAAASDSFVQLQPAMTAIETAMEASVAAGQHLRNDTSNGGKLMEETVLQVLQSSLPAGWSLLPSLHLLGADGEQFQVEQGCKYEVDILVLDEQGTAVAVVEVKLAALNPLMSLFNDVNALLSIVDSIAGKTVTGITKSAIPAVAAATTAATVADIAAGTSIVGGPVLAKAKAATQTAPFGEQLWHTIHVKVHPDIAPIYILGRGIGDTEVQRGLLSLADSTALKLMARSAHTAASMLLPCADSVQLEPQQHPHSVFSDSIIRTAGEDGTAVPSSSLAAVAGTLLQSLSRTSSSSSTDSASSTAAGGGAGQRRVVVNLSDDAQQYISSQLNQRLKVLDRCKIYSLRCP